MGKESTRTEASADGLIIQIWGRANRGKTTVARLIEEMLRKEGFTDVTVFDDLADSSPDKAPIEQRVAEAKARVVVIETIKLVELTGTPKKTIAPGEVPMAED